MQIELPVEKLLRGERRNVTIVMPDTLRRAIDALAPHQKKRSEWVCRRLAEAVVREAA